MSILLLMIILQKVLGSEQRETKACTDGHATWHKKKSTIGIPDADYDVMWQCITDGTIELAMSLGHIALTQPVSPQAQSLKHIGNHIHNHNCINIDGVGARYTRDVNEFLEELDADDNNEVLNHDDDLKGLDDALIIDVERECDDQEWYHNATIALMVTEEASCKAANEIKLRDKTTGHFNYPLTYGGRATSMITDKVWKT